VKTWLHNITAADNGWLGRIRGPILVLWLAGAVVAGAAALEFRPAEPNEISFPPQSARFVRIMLLDCQNGQPCLDELEVYGADGRTNLALATAGAKATASSLLAGYAIHQVTNLNDGRYGNSHSWIAAGSRSEWAQIELPGSRVVAEAVFSRDREGHFTDRTPGGVEVRLSDDGVRWRSVVRLSDVTELPEGPLREEDLLRYAFANEEASFRKLDGGDALRRVLQQFGEMIERFAGRGLDVSSERVQFAQFRQQERTSATNRAELTFAARLCKRQLFMREPDLGALERILFVKRQPYQPSHNYSDIFDPSGAPGGECMCAGRAARRGPIGTQPREVDGVVRCDEWRGA